MRAIILAAGRGSRLKSMTKENPKCLLMVKNKTLLDRIILNLKKNKISKISIVTGYKNKLIKKKNIKFFHNSLWSKTNMLYSLFQADEWLTRHTCLVTYSDIIYNHHAIKLLKSDKNSFSIISISNWKKIWKLRFSKPLSDLESFKITKNNILLNIGSREKNLKNIQGQYSGIFKISPPIWKKFKKVMKRMDKKKFYKLDMTNFFKILLKKKIRIKIVKFDKNWFEFDTKTDLKAYEKL